MGRYLIRADDPASVVELKGRIDWALRQLMTAGLRGCTPIDHPGPRWSAYIHKLRRAGFHIETIHEAHHGAYPGHHARYVLHNHVVELEPGDGA